MFSIKDFVHLTDAQETVLRNLEKEKWFTDSCYFIGGTLLKALDIVPRKSNDLDFFTFSHIEEKQYVYVISKLKNILVTIFGATNVQETKRGFLLTETGTRVECIYDVIPNIDEFVSFGMMKTASLKDCVANKSSAFCSRDEIKDYIDLAFLTKKQDWHLSDLARISEEKFGMQTISEEKLLIECLHKRDLFTIPPEIFLASAKENIAFVEEQIETLLQSTSL